MLNDRQRQLLQDLEAVFNHIAESSQELHFSSPQKNLAKGISSVLRYTVNALWSKPNVE